MKKIIIACLFSVYVLPRSQPMLDGMIIRCDQKTKVCRWECEFGIETATETVRDSLIVKPVGCQEENKKSEPIRWKGESWLQAVPL